jgi:hypothetical protein
MEECWAWAHGVSLDLFGGLVNRDHVSKVDSKVDLAAEQVASFGQSLRARG